MSEEEIPPEDIKVPPMEVKIINHPDKEKDHKEDAEYDDLFLSGEDIEEFENDGTQSK